MNSHRNVWAIILAAGEGTRLRELTTDSEGRSIPKQFCSINSGVSLLRRAVARGSTLAGLEHVVAVVAEGHRTWWQKDLGDLPQDNVIVQPCNRGTACGLLLPLLVVLHRDPEAIVLVLPSDHVAADETVLARSAERAVRAVNQDTGDGLVLLGVEPEEADQGYGWMVPTGPLRSGTKAVKAFVEKPDREDCEALMRRGALWNSSIFVARGTTLLTLFETVMPWLVRLFWYNVNDGSFAGQTTGLAQLFERLPTLDFSHSVLEQVPERLRVMPIPPCGWSDVGTPERVAQWIALDVSCPLDDPAHGSHVPSLDLADAVKRIEGHTVPAG